MAKVNFNIKQILFISIIFTSFSMFSSCGSDSGGVGPGPDPDPDPEEEVVYDYANMDQAKYDLYLKRNLDKYFGTEYSSKINNVSVSSTSVTVSGVCSDNEAYSLCEITPYDSLLMTNKFQRTTALTEANFTESFDRFVSRDGFTYDRALSKWVIVKIGNKVDKIVSHARYADDIETDGTPAQATLNGRKGIGGFDINRGFLSDLDELPATSVTVNIPILALISTSNYGVTIPHTYGGTTYYFNQGTVNVIDQTMLAAYERDIVVSAIILVQVNGTEAGQLLTHPDYNPSGIFTMPNMTKPESLNCYAAALDFLASRYCRSDNQYGRIHYWIMHNEVDAGVEWTNMGNNRGMEAYVDAYEKSMRLCHNISRQYDPNSQVLASFTHSWTEAVTPQYFASKSMIDDLLEFSKAEGDYQWGLAYHPYPESLFDPKVWEDMKATFKMGTPYITFKNLEVLDAWAKKSENMFQGNIKRTVFLSENGTNSPSYSETDLRNQAAGLAYTWKKLKVLDGIDAMQWHNWIDNRAEGGLRIGLRRFPDDSVDPGGKKPVWYVYQAADTDNEDSVFDQYKSVIGITDWSEVNFTGTIQ